MTVILFYLLLGSLSGTLAGLLGIGGGVVLVPGLAAIFSYFGDGSNVMQMATGTSLGIIAFTSIISCRSHYKRGAVDFSIVKKIFFYIVFGVFLGSRVSYLIKSEVLEIVFALFLLFVSYKMVFAKVNKKTDSSKTDFKLGMIDRLICLIIGLKSGLLGIGGGSMSVPYLVYRNIDVRKAIGTSALIGLTLSWVGALSHIFIGYQNSGSFHHGINLMALCSVAPMSMIFAPIGVKLSHALPVLTLRRFFGAFVFIVAVKMIL